MCPCGRCSYFPVLCNYSSVLLVRLFAVIAFRSSVQFSSCLHATLSPSILYCKAYNKIEEEEEEEEICSSRV